MFQDDDILLAFKNTVIFTVAIVILRNLFAILLALALVKKLYTRRICVQFSIFLPF